MLFAFGALFLLLRFLSTAARRGPYDAAAPKALSRFGWFSLLGGPVCVLVEVVSLSSSSSSFGLTVDWAEEWGARFPEWSAAAGLAALAFAYILRVGVADRLGGEQRLGRTGTR
ncbi:hypothetical protein ABZ345_05595 [Lentzea sp. NPDC005914]|uniref:hypothetical protein n=1 Tax=Lentzea sp. NPDC005914 TaxID=3154572 RepID=UPI0033DC807A